ncbi:MAG: TetR/AcrR family transcriptional regulator [Balneolaceae bacterium]|nr:TetR/AcrR family transcriptional regulator [Balneolaceae bacterium]
MTEKKRNIIDAAAQLFSSNGFSATSTSKIAEKAGVSEGLIFRHFGNKSALLDTILAEGEQRLKSYYSDIVFESDPREVLRKIIELPFVLTAEDLEFCRLQTKLAWEMNATNSSHLKPHFLKVELAFKKLGVDNPKMETDVLFYLIEGINAALLNAKIEDADAVKAFLINKYLS